MTKRGVKVLMKGYYVHESSYIDENVEVGEGTKIWHFCHIQSGAKIGRNCSLGQNVNIANNVIIGNDVKIQNNVSIYEGVEIEDGVFCGPSCVFTNDLTPRARFPKGKEYYKKTLKIIEYYIIKMSDRIKIIILKCSLIKKYED